MQNRNRTSLVLSPFLYASDIYSSQFQTSCCVQEASWTGTVLFLRQQKRNLKQGHVNWPRYCNHVHKGQYPAWEETSTSCRSRQLLCTGGGFNFNAPVPLWSLASDELLGPILWHSPFIQPSINSTPLSPPPSRHVSLKTEEFAWHYTMIDET